MLETALIIVPLALTAAYAWWDRRRRRDRIWLGVTPGERPMGATDGEKAVEATVDEGSYLSTVPVRFTPPDGMTPGMAGTIIDGRADPADVAATLVDLAVRDHVKLHAVPGTRTEAGRPTWQIERLGAPGRGSSRGTKTTATTNTGSDTTLETHERQILDHLETTESPRVDHLPPQLIRSMQQTLADEAVEHGWLTPPVRPRPRRIGIALAAAGLLVAAVSLFTTASAALALGGGLVGSGLLLALLPVPPVTRTASGTATRIQALGFQRYLATAEARQIRLEEAQDIFSRFLPWAIAFGVAQQWAKTFAEAAALGHASGVEVAIDLHWVDGLELLAHGSDVIDALHLLEHADPANILDAIDGLTDGLGDAVDLLGSGLGDLADGLSWLGDGIGAIFEGLGDL